MDVERIELEPRRVVGLHEVVPMDRLTAFFDRAYHSTGAAVGAAGVPLEGPALALYRGEVGETVDVTGGFYVPGGTEAPEGLEALDLPTGPAVTTVHTGPYDTLAQTYAELTAWMGREHVVPGQLMWEEYLTDPQSEPDPARWQTRIVWPLG